MKCSLNFIKKSFHFIKKGFCGSQRHAKAWTTKTINNFWHKGTLWQKRLKRSGAITSAIVILLIIGLLIYPFQHLKAANYTKTWTSTADFDNGTKSNIDTSGDEAKLASTTTNFSEGFTDTTYKDAATDANWNTTANKLTLPGGVDVTDLHAKWEAVAGYLEGISVLTYDHTNHFIYLGGSKGSFVAYNPANSTAINLTAKISADWSANNFYALTFDSTNGIVYLGGLGGKFGCFTGGADPANGTWVYLTPKISADWGTVPTNTLSFDSTNGKVYLGGSGGRFGAFTGGADPANGTWVYLTSKISADWSTKSIGALTFDSTNGKVYLGGADGKFGAFTGGADPANGTWVYLYPKISGNWATGYIRAMTFDSTNGKVYLGGDDGKFGVFTGGADPANGTWVYLTPKISVDWGTTSYAIQALTFDSIKNKVYLGGLNAKFGVFTGGADPANGTWVYLSPEISAIWDTSHHVYALTFDSTNGEVYLGGSSPKFASFSTGYVSNKNGISLAVDNTVKPIAKATLTATDSKPDDTAITYYLSNDGGNTWNVVTSGVLYTFVTVGSDLRWKANLTTTDVAVTPEITNIAIAYVFYATSSGTLNLKYDASQAVIIVGLSGAYDLLANTTLIFKVRAATTEGGLTTATWSDNIPAADLPKDLRTINVGGQTGFSDNQWSEIQADFATSDDLNTPTLSDLTLTYVINAVPEVQNITATQLTDDTKTVSIGYEIRDTDTNTNPYNAGQVSVSFDYSIDSGVNWLDCTTITNTGLKNVEQVNFTPYTSVWNIGTDLADSYYNNTVKVKAMIDDNEQAHNTAELASSTFSIDTNNPAPGAIDGGFTGVRIADGTSWTNDTTPDLTISAFDDNSLTMKVSNDNFVTGDWESYATSKAGWPLSVNDGNKTVYVRFRDAFGNTADANSTVLLDTTPPAVPTQFTIFDTSSQNLGTYSITSIWDVINNPGDFSLYYLERSINGADYSELATLPNIASDVYVDKNLSNAITYYYRLRAKDIHNNYSDYTDVKELMSVGVDTVAPEITGPGPTSVATSTTANISWLTNEIADSYVEFGTTIAYGSMQGSDELVSSHSVTLVGLNPTTTYHYRVKSRDATGNRVASADYTFTTTLPEEVNSGVNITGATAQKPGADPEEVTIIWTTDKYSTSQVLYGKTESLGSQTAEDSTLNKTHYVIITHLDPNTKYFYKAKSKDTYGNVIEGELKYFVTSESEAVAPSVKGVESTDITLNSAIISWETTTVTSSIVELGNEDGYSGRVEDISAGSTTKHVIRLKELSEGTVYHFRVLGMNSNQGWVASDDYQFSTISFPTITDITVKDVGSIGATITWQTNVPTDSNVDYGLEAANISQGSGEEATNHSISLIGLKPAAKYLYKIRVRDKYGNQAISKISSFQTIIDTTAPVIKDMKSEISIIIDQSGDFKAQAIISWSTDEVATSQVKYAMGVAVNDAYPLATDEETGLTTSHVMIITGLQPSATYHMRLLSKDSSGNLATSDDYTVLTLNQEKSLLQYIIQILEERFFWLKTFNLF